MPTLLQMWDEVAFDNKTLEYDRPEDTGWAIHIRRAVDALAVLSRRDRASALALAVGLWSVVP
jgi:hypothetical protein